MGIVLNVLVWGLLIAAKVTSKKKGASAVMLDPVARAVAWRFRETGKLPNAAEFAAEPSFLAEHLQYSPTSSNVFQLSCVDAHYGPATKIYTVTETNLTMGTAR